MALSEPTDAEATQIIETFLHVRDSSRTAFPAFVKFYHEEACIRVQANDLLLTLSQPALGTHDATRAAALKLRASCAETKTQFQDDVLPNTSLDEKERCTRMLVRLTFMIDCASAKDHSMKFKLNSKDGFPTTWNTNQTFVDFFSSAFPTYAEAQLHISEIDRNLKAWKLQHRHGIRIISTNDLVQHLFYNKNTKTISIFNQTAYLKAHLRHSVDTGWSDSVEENLRRGTLPPQLLLETLYSIYLVLFPLAEKRAAKLAKRLVNARNEQDQFDPDFEQFERFDYGNSAQEFKYIYWAQRLRTLQNITIKPPPPNKILSWVERHTSERNALTVALIGLFLSVLFGILGVAVGAVSAMFQYLAWKYPVR